MNRVQSCVTWVGAALLLTLSANAQPPAGAPGQPGGQPGGGAPYVPKNLKVLPDNTDLRKVMRGYTGDLGVECEYCHSSVKDPVTNRPDRASDANPVKDKARTMITLTQDLNSKYLPLIADRKNTDAITCGTCHRGAKYPAVYVAPPRPEGNRPPGAGGPPAGAPPATPPAGN